MNITDPVQIAVAQCTDEKKDGTHPAKELYDESDLFQAQLRYARAETDGILIVSGKHGLLAPDDEIASYDTHIDDAAWGERVQDDISYFFRTCQPGSWRMLDLAIDESMSIPIPSDFSIEFVLLCGEKYAEKIVPYLDSYDLEYTEPFSGLRYQERIQAMIGVARKAENNKLSEYA